MAWLIKTEINKLEIWSDNKFDSMTRKCEYYGAKPLWRVLSRVDKNANPNGVRTAKISKI